MLLKLINSALDIGQHSQTKRLQNGRMLSNSVNILLSLVARAVGVVSIFACNLLIARRFGAEGLGYFQVCYSTILIAGNAGRLGLDQLGLRTAAGSLQRDSKAISSWMDHSLLAATAGLTMIILALLVLEWAGLWPREAQGSSLSYLLFMLAILPGGLLFLLTETMRGRNLFKLAIFAQSSLSQGLFLLALVIDRAFFSASWITLSTLYLLSNLSAFAFTWAAWNRKLSPILLKGSVDGAMRNARAAFVLWTSTLITALAASIDVLILGIYAPTADIGRYAAIIRTGALVGTVVQVSTAGYVPAAAADFAQGKTDKFRRDAMRWSVGFATVAFPISIVLFTWHGLLGTIWGNGFEGQGSLLTIYGVAQLIQAITGICGLLLPVMYVDRAMIVLAVINLIFRIGGVGIGYAAGGLAGAIWGISIALLASNAAVMVIFFLALRKKKIQSMLVVS